MHFDLEAESFKRLHTAASSPEIIDMLQKTVSNLPALSFTEALNLYRFTQRTLKIPGDIAEVGVYTGGSAKILALASQGKKKIHLFDTFEGFPEATEGVDLVKAGEFETSFDAVKNYLKEFSFIDFHKGIFPETAEFLKNTPTRFSLVNLDADTYVTTLKALEFFYPRMTVGGFIVLHDYHAVSCPGVKKAVEEFFADKPETIIDLWYTQVMIVKS